MLIISTLSLFSFLFGSVHARSVGACLFNLPFPFIRPLAVRQAEVSLYAHLLIYHFCRVSGSLPDVQPIAKNIRQTI